MMTFSLLKDEGVRLRTKSSSVLLGAAIVCLVGWPSSPARTLWTIPVGAKRRISLAGIEKFSEMSLMTLFYLGQ